MTGYREKQLAKGTSFNKFNCSAKDKNNNKNNKIVLAM